MEAKRQLQKSSTERIQFSLHELLRFVTLVPLSIGFVHVVESCCADILRMLDPDPIIALSKSIASYLGLLHMGHGFVVLAIMHVPETLLLFAFILFVYHGRLQWFNEMALSLILATPLLTVLHFVWVPGFQIDLHGLSVLLVYSVAPVVASLTVFVMYRLLTSRLKNDPESQARKTIVNRQKIMSFAVCVLYLISCFYGWYDLCRSHAETLRELRVLQERVRDVR